MSRKQDNSTLQQKIALRSTMLEQIEQPIVMETHGGFGRIWESCYLALEDGVVFEKKRDRASELATARPTWAVYEGDSAKLLAHGVGAHLPVNFLDVDPYGQCWPTLRGFFESDRPFADSMALVVNDGLRFHLMSGRGWDTDGFEDVVRHFGNDLFGIYLDVCEWLLGEIVRPIYTVKTFSGYYCGIGKKMTHFAAILEKTQSPA